MMSRIASQNAKSQGHGVSSPAGRLKYLVGWCEGSDNIWNARGINWVGPARSEDVGALASTVNCG
jgi:hypothetical protein